MKGGKLKRISKTKYYNKKMKGGKLPYLNESSQTLDLTKINNIEYKGNTEFDIFLYGKLLGKILSITLTRKKISEDPKYYEKLLKKIFTFSTISNESDEGKHLYNATEYLPGTNLKISHIEYPITEKTRKKGLPSYEIKVNETPQIYEEITVPLKVENSLKPWISNIINKTSERENFINENKYFINTIHPEKEKTDNNLIITEDDFYLLLWSKNINIKSIRDLRGIHIPMLLSAYELVNSMIRNKEVIAGDGKTRIINQAIKPDILIENQLVFFFHYHPSLWVLHIHVMTLKSFKNTSTRHDILNAYLLDDVINNLRIDGNYYKDATISFMQQVIPSKGVDDIGFEYIGKKNRDTIMIEYLRTHSTN